MFYKSKRNISIMLVLIIILTILPLDSLTKKVYAVETIRLGGKDRYETSNMIAQAGWKTTSRYAVLATGDDFPDALSAAPLAQKYSAPILLTDKDSLSEKVLSEIKRLGADYIFIVGGIGVVSQGVESKLKGMGISTERLNGKDRFETSIKIAEKLGFGSREIVIANGYEFAEALSVSSIAAKNGMPIVLTEKDKLPLSTKAFIDNSNFSKTYVLGDTDLISNTVASQLPSSERIIGKNVYERNINIIKKFEKYIDFTNVCVATMRDFPDALAGSALAANFSSPIILVDDSNIQDITAKYINGKQQQVKNIYVFGLEGAVNDNAISALFKSSNNESVAIKSPIYPVSTSFDDKEGQLANVKRNPLDESYIKALNNFSYKTVSKILRNQPKNISYSPVSLYMALTLAGTGANGTTQDEIFSALGVSGKDTNFLSKQNSNLFNLLYYDNQIGNLKIANSLWLQKDAYFKDAFINNTVQNFYASVYNADFSDESTANLMSKWVSENTNGIIAPKISLEKDQIMSIINTIYLKDEWFDKFNNDDTKPDIFHLNDGKQINCDYMNRSYNVHGFVKGDGFTSSSVELKNLGSMKFILPDKGVSVDDLLSTPEKVDLVFNEENMEGGEVIFKIPKFSYGSDFDVTDTLNSMGVKSAFKPNADFTGMSDHKAFISNIKQQTHIAIDERGVEAAAFTQILWAGSAPANGKVANMILDRPFIFAIKSNSGEILFVGVVNNPIDK